jgi:hypothetical protein
MDEIPRFAQNDGGLQVSTARYCYEKRIARWLPFLTALAAHFISIDQPCPKIRSIAAIILRALDPVLEFATQSSNTRNFWTADRWDFGLCATIPREPRQARKGATVTGQFRVPRNTRSSFYRRSRSEI